MKTCKICKKKFKQKRSWQKICSDAECKKELARRTTRRWRKNNYARNKKYQSWYRGND